MYDRETKEHLGGKRALYQRLKELYPDSRVELEYKVFETSQRADVMVVHPSDEKWAFEFQCYPISDEIWRTRHDLYRSADIKDFWVLGSSLYKQTENMRRLRILELAIREEFGHLIYLDVSTEEFATLEDGFVFNRLLANSQRIRFKLEDAYILNSMRWWSQTLSDWEDEKPRDAKKRQAQSTSETNQSSPDPLSPKFKKQTPIWVLREETKRRSRVATVGHDPVNQRYELLYRERDFFTDRMDPVQANEFRHMCSKYNFGKASFPGVLNLEVELSCLIQSPLQLWQLWIYDVFIYHRNTVDGKDIVNAMKSQMDIFHPAPLDDAPIHWSFAVYNFLRSLDDVRILAALNPRRTIFEIAVPELPRVTNRGDNIRLKMVLEALCQKCEIREYMPIYSKYRTRVRGMLSQT